MSKIFVFRVGTLGDSVVALPAIKMLHENSNKKLGLITNSPQNKSHFFSWGLYKHTDYFDDYFEFENNSFKNLLTLVKKMRVVKERKSLFYFVDESSFFRNFRNYLFFKLCGFDSVYGWKESIGKYIKKTPDGKLLRVENEHKRLEKIVEKYLTTSSFNQSSEFGFIKFDTDFVEKINQRFSDFINSSFIVLGIGGKSKVQKWDIENYINLAIKILEVENINILLLGGDGEIKESSKIEDKIKKNIINLCGKTNILESAYLLKMAKLYIGNDTGTMHLASIVGTRCLVLSSARDNPGRWEPYGQNHLVMRKSVDCEGCHLSVCYKNGYECMTQITINEVFEKYLLSEL